MAKTTGISKKVGRTPLTSLAAAAQPAVHGGCSPLRMFVLVTCLRIAADRRQERWSAEDADARYAECTGFLTRTRPREGRFGPARALQVLSGRGRGEAIVLRRLVATRAFLPVFGLFGWLNVELGNKLERAAAFVLLRMHRPYERVSSGREDGCESGCHGPLPDLAANRTPFRRSMVDDWPLSHL